MGYKRLNMEVTRREGFWYSTTTPDLPMPVGLESIWVGKSHFLAKLTVAEGKAIKQQYRGFSRCRLCGCVNGSAEFQYKGWCWPSGLRHYVQEHNVRPSLAFQEFIICEEVN